MQIHIIECRLQNVCHFVQASMYKQDDIQARRQYVPHPLRPNEGKITK